MNWSEIYNLSTEYLDFTFSLLIEGLVILGIFMALISLGLFFAYRKNPQKKLFFLGPLIIGILIAGVSLGFSLSQQPLAVEARILEKHIDNSNRPTPTVLIQIKKAYYYTENGKGEAISQLGNSMELPLSEDLYERVEPGFEVILLVLHEQFGIYRGFGYISESGVFYGTNER